MSITLDGSHQTVLFVRVTDNDSDRYRERASALVGSLNRAPDYVEGGTIKADVYSVNDKTGQITKGLSWPDSVDVNALRVEAEAAGFALVAKDTVGGRISSPALRALAEKAGYVQSLVVEPNSKERVSTPSAVSIFVCFTEYDDDDYDDDDYCDCGCGMVV